MDLLSSSVIKETSFSQARKGYSTEEVDIFKERVLLTVDVLTQQNDTAREEKDRALERADAAERGASSSQHSVDEPSENALRLLNAAKDTSERVVDEAQKEAQKIVDDANKFSDDTRRRADEEFKTSLSDITRRRDELENQIHELESVALKYQAHLRKTISASLSEIENILPVEFLQAAHPFAEDDSSETPEREVNGEHSPDKINSSVSKEDTDQQEK